MRRFFMIFLRVIGTINAISCIVLLFVLCPRIVREQNIGFDYMGVIVAILAILVTLLITWNIYSALNIKRDMDKAKDDYGKLNETLVVKANDIKKEFTKKEKEHELKIDTHLLKIQKDIVTTRDGLMLMRAQIEEDFAKLCGTDAKKFPEVIPHIFKAVLCWSEANSYVNAEECIKFLNVVIPNPEEIPYPDKKRSALIELVKTIPQQEKISNVGDLYVFLSKLGSKHK